MDLLHKSADFEIKDPEQGVFKAIFSTFNVIDADGDVVTPGAIPDGLEVPVVVAHDWSQLPVGKGIISTSRKNAIIDGQFNLSMQQGRDAWESVKFQGKTQQLSWGFKVNQYDFGQFEGKDVRFIRDTQPMEVSFVLVGSNPKTGVLAVKAPEGREDDLNDHPKGPETSPVPVGDWKQEAALALARARYGGDS